MTDSLILMNITIFPNIALFLETHFDDFSLGEISNLKLSVLWACIAPEDVAQCNGIKTVRPIAQYFAPDACSKIKFGYRYSKKSLMFLAFDLFQYNSWNFILLLRNSWTYISHFFRSSLHVAKQCYAVDVSPNHHWFLLSLCHWRSNFLMFNVYDIMSNITVTLTEKWFDRVYGSTLP